VLLVHGLLHLAGYDHEEGGAQAEAMMEAEQELMQRLSWRVGALIWLFGEVGGYIYIEIVSVNDNYLQIEGDVCLSVWVCKCLKTKACNETCFSS
jgi:hypothetical protein